MKHKNGTIVTVKEYNGQSYRATIVGTDDGGTKYQVWRHGWMDRPIRVVVWVFPNEIQLSVTPADQINR